MAPSRDTSGTRQKKGAINDKRELKSTYLVVAAFLADTYLIPSIPLEFDANPPARGSSALVI
ncbi:hypothetical protein BV22DRAFT_1042274 [Leucogyrophana mollusca]|uniref:Uncharacterized protein n=1 Tax=Leucogyrophana mollusca TaxID=85980 RepID=A0ACB8AVV3_9AGAM|nr:hypothetical protein BV22DRAFT_1042274 [Leucogyrophana mollusca]